MKEIEVKAKVPDKDDLLRGLTQQGCELSEPVLQIDHIFTESGKGFDLLPHGSTILRIREQNGIYTLNLKKALTNALDRLERELIISDHVVMQDILHYLGFEEVICVRKQRRKGHFGDYDVCVDEVEGLGSFIELEKLSEEENSTQIQQEIFVTMQQFGIRPEDRVMQPYDIMLFEQRKQ